MTDVTIVSYRDLGTQVGQTLTNTAEGFYERGTLNRVLCRGVVETQLPDNVVCTSIPFGRYIPSGLWAVSNYGYEFDHRVYSEALLDVLASRRIPEDRADIHYYEYAGLLRSLRRSNGSGKTTVLVGGTEFADAALERRVAELRRFDRPVDVPESRRRQTRKRSRTVFEADYHVVLSSFVADSYRDAGVPDERITVIPQAVDPEKYPAKETYGTDRFRALFVGSMPILKGIPYLLKAWDRLGWDKDDTAELQLCGNVTAETKPIIEGYDFSSLDLPGWVDPGEYYRDASVFVFPSLTEGFSKATLEAMSSGTPVIVTENSGTPDVIEDGEEGFVVPIRDPAALAEKLQYFRNNPGEIERMGRNARKTAEEYTWERFVDTVVEHLDRISTDEHTDAEPMGSS